MPLPSNRPKSSKCQRYDLDGFAVGSFVILPLARATVLLVLLVASSSAAYIPVQYPSKEIARTWTSCLHLAKSRARNKQAELAQKLAQAKQQQQSSISEDATPKQLQQPPSEEFAKLLNTTRSALPQRDHDDEQAFLPDIQAGQRDKPKVVKRAQPATPKPVPKAAAPVRQAQRVHFEALVPIYRNNGGSTPQQPLGAMAAAQLCPWVPPFVTERLVVVCDPRPSSGDLRAAAQYLLAAANNNEQHSTTNPKAIRNNNQVICIAADNAKQAQSWWRRIPNSGSNDGASSSSSSPIRLFVDPDLEWMTAYKVVGNDNSRWSLTMIVFDSNGAIRRLGRNVDPSHVVQLVREEEEKKKS